MRHAMLLTILCVAFLVGGCQASMLRAPVEPPPGALVTSYRAPITTDFEETPRGQKVGTASTLYFHDFILTGLSFAWGEAGVRRAAREGNISEVHYADYSRLQILGFFGRYTTEVHGK